MCTIHVAILAFLPSAPASCSQYQLVISSCAMKPLRVICVKLHHQRIYKLRWRNVCACLCRSKWRSLQRNNQPKEGDQAVNNVSWLWRVATYRRCMQCIWLALSAAAYRGGQPDHQYGVGLGQPTTLLSAVPSVIGLLTTAGCESVQLR